MTINCNTKTITEIVNNKITISCLSSDNQDGVDIPTLFRADMLTEPKTINKISGSEGELLLTHTDSGTVAKITTDGELILELEDDDATKYSVNEEGELIYGQ
jgi:hypothetical protein